MRQRVHFVPDRNCILGSTNNFDNFLQMMPAGLHRTNILCNIFAERHKFGRTESGECHIAAGCHARCASHWCVTTARCTVISKTTKTTTVAASVGQTSGHYPIELTKNRKKKRNMNKNSSKLFLSLDAFNARPMWLSIHECVLENGVPIEIEAIHSMYICLSSIRMTQKCLARASLNHDGTWKYLSSIVCVNESHLFINVNI